MLIFELSSNVELVIAAGETASTGTVSIAAVDNDSKDGKKMVSVSASAANAGVGFGSG